MGSKIMEFHLSKDVQVFVKVREILDNKHEYSIEEIIKTIDELSEYEKEIKKLKQQIIIATDMDIMSTLIERARAT